MVLCQLSAVKLAFRREELLSTDEGGSQSKCLFPLIFPITLQLQNHQSITNGWTEQMELKFSYEFCRFPSSMKQALTSSPRFVSTETSWRHLCELGNTQLCLQYVHLVISTGAKSKLKRLQRFMKPCRYLNQANDSQHRVLPLLLLWGDKLALGHLPPSRGFSAPDSGNILQCAKKIF